MLGKIEGWRGRGWQRMRWLYGITDLMDMSLSTGSWWLIGKLGMLQSLGSQRVGPNWTQLNWQLVKPEWRPWKWKSLSCVRLFVTPWTVIHARILGWVDFPFSRGSSQTKDRTQVSHIAGGFFTSWVTRKAQEYWCGYPILFQWIFRVQESNWGINILHFRWILSQLSYQGVKTLTTANFAINVTHKIWQWLCSLLQRSTDHSVVFPKAMSTD